MRDQELTDQVGASLDNEIAQIQILSAGLINNLQFLDACETYESSTETGTSHTSALDIEAHLSDFFRYTSKIGMIYLLFPEKPFISFQNYPLIGFQEFKSQEYLQPALEKPGINHTIPELFGVNPLVREKPMLSIAVSPSPTNSHDGLEVMLLSFRIPVLSEILVMDRQPGSQVFLADSDGRILLAGEFGTITGLEDLDLATSEYENPVRTPHGTYLVSFSQMSSTGWRLYRILDYEQILRPLLRYRRGTYLMFAFLSLVFVIFTFVFFRSLLRPLQTIIGQMSIVETGDYSVQVPVEGHGEMAHLGEAFNRMTSEIGRLTDESLEREAEKNRYEMEALQYRIHPHFVANTLNSIRIMADAEDSPHIAEMSASLMRLITESFNKGGRLITIEDEKISLQSYIHIMKVRFGELIDLRFRLPDKLLSQKILKMMLQPLVENSVLHGIRETDRMGLIEITGALEHEALLIEVIDNGAGIPEDVLAGILENPVDHQTQGFTRIGIHNVHRRIQLNYGEGYGLSIVSRTGKGTTVTLRLPADLVEDV